MDIRDICSERIAVHSHDTVDKPNAAILMIHGLGEHAGRYNELAERFTKAGIVFRAFDLPGHGSSGGRRGTMPELSRVYSIIEILTEDLKNEFPGVPVILYGHSLGGGLLLNMLITFRPEIAGAVVTSPWLKLAETPPPIKVGIARIMGKIMPGLVQASGLRTEYLSHDQKVVDAYINDPLVHGLISAGLFISMTEAAEETLKRASEINIPLLLMHGRDDMIISPSGTLEIAASVKSCTLKLWEGGYHEVHNDTMKDEHFEFICEWIDTLI